MNYITRRKAAIYIGNTVLGASLGGCCPLTSIVKENCKLDKPKEPRKLVNWKDEAEEWWTKRRPQGQQNLPRSRPHLVIWRRISPRGHPGYQLSRFELGEWGEYEVNIENKGTAPSFNCVVELFEAPLLPYDLRFSQFTRTGSIIISIMPGEQKNVLIPWRQTREAYGSTVARCYDPFHDPANNIMEQHDRKNGSIGWSGPVDRDAWDEWGPEG